MTDPRPDNPFRVLPAPAEGPAPAPPISEADALREEAERGVLFTTVGGMVNWAVNQARANAIWPLGFGLACCAIEMMAMGASRFDIARFGAEVFRPSPRQADLMIVAGTVNYKMASRLKRLYHQMAEPKYVMAMGACTVGGGPYFKYGYNVVKGVDLVVPVDVYVPGCPPRPEALTEGLLKLQEKMMTERWLVRSPNGNGTVKQVSAA